jgi:hypothetical protein
MVNNNCGSFLNCFEDFLNSDDLAEGSFFVQDENKSDQQSNFLLFEKQNSFPVQRAGGDLSFLSVPVVSSSLTNQTQERIIQNWQLREQPQVMTINSLAMYNWASGEKVAIDLANPDLKLSRHPAQRKYTVEIEFTAQKALSLVCQAKLWTASAKEMNYLTISEVQEKASNKRVYLLTFDRYTPVSQGNGPYYISLTFFEASQEICRLTSPVFKLLAKKIPNSIVNDKSVKETRAPKRRRIEAPVNSNSSVKPSPSYPSTSAFQAPILTGFQEQSNPMPFYVPSLEQAPFLGLPQFNSKEEMIQYIIGESQRQAEEIKSLKQQVIYLIGALQQARQTEPNEGNDNDPSQDFFI